MLRANVLGIVRCTPIDELSASLNDLASSNDLARLWWAVLEDTQKLNLERSIYTVL